MTHFKIIKDQHDIKGQKKIFGRIWVTKYKLHILRNIFFCVQQNKDIHTGLKQLEGE